MKKDEIANLLHRHEKWLNNEDGGERANLRDADLQGADLQGANLRDANLRDADLRWISAGNGKHIITIQSLEYSIVYTSQILAIGCQQHPISKWMKFDNRLIEKMDDSALDWWKVHKPLLMSWIEANPATPTKESIEDEKTA